MSAAPATAPDGGGAGEGEGDADNGNACPGRLMRVEAVLRRRTQRFVVVLEHVLDDHNQQAVMRTAEAMGIQVESSVSRDGTWHRRIGLRPNDVTVVTVASSPARLERSSRVCRDDMAQTDRVCLCTTKTPLFSR
jgi:hypothetical protein